MLTSDDLAFFAVLARSRSLADGARRLNVSPPAVTQRLRALETRAGVRLLDRSGGRLALTDEGAMVAEHASSIGDALEDLSEALMDRNRSVVGHLRVSAPHGFGREHVAPVIDAFAKAHPRATVTLDLSDHPAARLIESSDCVIHIGPPGPPEAIVTTLAANRRILCASPSYLSATAPIVSPRDLADHRCLALRENEEDVTLWHFTDRHGRSETIRIRSVMSTNDGTVVREWAESGLGLAIRSEWDVAKGLRDGRLLRVLPDWEAPTADVVALLGWRHGRSIRGAAFLAMLRASLSPPPWRRQQMRQGPHD